jgi:hypothetical protein
MFDWYGQSVAVTTDFFAINQGQKHGQSKQEAYNYHCPVKFHRLSMMFDVIVKAYQI